MCVIFFFIFSKIFCLLCIRANQVQPVHVEEQTIKQTLT